MDRKSFTTRMSQKLDSQFGTFDDFGSQFPDAENFASASERTTSADPAPFASGNTTAPQPSAQSAAPSAFSRGTYVSERDVGTRAATNPLQFSNVTSDPALQPQGIKDIGVLGRLVLRYERGQLTKEQVLKTTQLMFNTEFNHLALQASLRLSEANQIAIFEYLRRTTDLRKRMSKQIGRELVCVVEVYWNAVERAARARGNWRNTITKLQADGMYSQAEADDRMVQATEMMMNIETECKALSDQIIADVMDKVTHALAVRVQDLIGDDSASASKLLPK